MRASLSASLLALVLATGLPLQAQRARAAAHPAAKKSGAAPAATISQVPIPPLHEFKPQKPVRIQLENGMVIFLQEDHELPTIDGSVMIRGGSREMPAAKAGMAGIYAQAWRTSGTKTRNGDQLDDLLEAKAAKVETSAGTASTSVSFSCLKQDFDTVFASFVDLLQSPEFRDDKIELAKRRTKTAISRRNDEIDEIAGRELRKIAYGADSPYARVPEYWTVDAVTKQDLIDWHARTVHPNNMILGVVGDFDARQMESTLRKTFGALPKGNQITPAKETFNPPAPQVYYAAKTDVNQSDITLVTLGIERKNPDFYAVAVMNELFGGGFSSRLFSTIRSKMGLAYSVGGGIGSDFDHPGIFRLSMGTKSATTAQSISALNAEIQHLIKDPGSEEEVKRAKDNILNSFIFNFDSKDKVMREEMTYEFFGYPLNYLDTFRAEIEKVTPQDIARVVEKYVAPAKFATLVVGNAADFDKPLSTFGQVKTIDLKIPEAPGASQSGSAAGGSTAAPPAKPAVSNDAGKQLIQKIVTTLGGKAKLNAVKSVEWVASQVRHTPQGDLTLNTDQVVAYPDKAHLTMQTPMGAMEMIITPEHAYMKAGGQQNEAPAAMKDDFLKDLHRDFISVAQHVDDPNYSFQSGGAEKLGGKDVTVLDVNGDGATTRWYVDSASGEILKAAFRATGQAGPVDREIEFSDYRDANGLRLPYKRVTRENGEVVAETSVTEIKLNPAVDAAMFAKP